MSEFFDKATLPDSSDLGPALASHLGRLFIAWKGSGNENLNVGVFQRDGRHLADKHTSSETSSHAPALISTQNGLFLAWKGSGNDELNGARVDTFANTAGGFGIEGLSNKSLLRQTSEAGPALAADNGGAIFIAWRGSGNENLNIASAGGNLRTSTSQGPLLRRARSRLRSVGSMVRSTWLGKVRGTTISVPSRCLADRDSSTESLRRSSAMRRPTPPRLLPTPAACLWLGKAPAMSS